MWSSWAEPLLAWRRTRYPVRVFGPLAAGVALAAHAVGAPLTPHRFAAGTGLAWLLVLGFRLWDDLADRDEDCARHPERVLAQATSLAPFRVALVVLTLGGAVGLASLGGVVPRLGLLALVVAGLGVWYGGFRRLWPSPVVHYHVVLGKYPAVVALLGEPPAGVHAGRALPVLAVVYLALCVYESLHDVRLRVAPGARRALAVDVVLLVVASGVVCLEVIAAVWRKTS